MNRREFLLGAGGAMSIATAGCLGQGRERDELAVEATGPNIGPGETATIRAYGYNLRHFRFRVPGRGPVEIEDFDVSPSAPSQADSVPPIWVWDDTQSSVEATLTISLPSDADIDEYTYEIEVRRGSNGIRSSYTVDVRD